MANISSAHGSFIFEGDFALAQKQNFVEVMASLRDCGLQHQVINPRRRQRR